MNPEQAILLVEDNDDDAELTVMAFTSARIPNPVVRVRDGIEALDYLLEERHKDAEQRPELPAIVLLDLNLPRLDGLGVLRAIRSDQRVRHLPVVVLTSSDEETDRLAAYREFANSYVRKPVDYDHFAIVARDLGLYWLVINRPLPRLGS